MSEAISITLEQYDEMLRKCTAYDMIREYNLRSDVMADEATKAILGLNYKPYPIAEKEPYRLDSDNSGLPFPECFE